MINVSFIIPFYNGEDTIKNCLNSIYSTGMEEPSFEIIIVDDFSPTPASQVLKDNYLSHNNIRIIRHSENLCQGGAKNTGIKNSVGKYIVFADQDDQIISENLTIAVTEALQCNPDILACKYIVRHENGREEEKGLDHPTGFSTDGKTFCESYFDPGYSLAPWSYIYRRDYLISISHPMAERVLMEDADWIAWHLLYAKSIDYLPIPIYCWVRNSSSITHGMTWRHKADYVKFGYRKIRDSLEFTKTSELFAKTMETDGKYNIEHTFKKLWKIDNYSLFYQHVGNDVIDGLRNIRWSRKTTFMLNYPNLTSALLSMFGPLIKQVHRLSSVSK